MTAILSAISGLRDQLKQGEDLSLEYASEDEFLKGLAGLARMLHSPSLKRMLAGLETYQGSTVGDLIAFMQAYNLRFGPARSDRQKDLYHQLLSLLGGVLANVSGESPDAALNSGIPSRDASGQPFQAAARQAFRGMRWDELKPTPER